MCMHMQTTKTAYLCYNNMFHEVTVASVNPILKYIQASKEGKIVNGKKK